MDKIFLTPFAATGDKLAVPITTQPDGSVSYPQGFGPDYQADPGSDPDAKDVPRDSMNQLFYDLTNAVKEYQTFGTPDFITSAENGGVPYSYAINAHVRYSDGDIYESRIAANTDLPTVSASWRKISGGTQGNLIADAAGTVNAMTAAFTPSQTAYVAGVPLFIRAFGANSSGTPTINIDGLGAKTICKGANNPLVSADIPGAGFWMILQYDTALNKMVLANPARGSIKNESLLAQNGYRYNQDGSIEQWGYVASLSEGSVNTPVVFPIPFPNSVLNAVCTGGAVGTGANINQTVNSITNSGMNIVNTSNTAVPGYWRAIGF